MNNKWERINLSEVWINNKSEIQSSMILEYESFQQTWNFYQI